MGPALLGVSRRDDEGHLKKDLLGFSCEFLFEMIFVVTQEVDIKALLLMRPLSFGEFCSFVPKIIL